LDEDEICFRALDNGKHYVECSRLDGTSRRRVIATPIVDFHSISPDHRWLFTEDPFDSSGASLRGVAHEFGGPGTITLCDNCVVSWSGDGRTAYFRFDERTSDRTVAVPTTNTLPHLTHGGAGTSTDAQRLPGARLVDPSREPAPYAYVKSIVQRNLFRIPLK
jgi:hypothetical protein